MLSDSKLRRWYREFNRKYHNGELPNDVDIFYAPMEDCSGLVDFHHGETLLIINPMCALDSTVLRMTLHHEMAHIKTQVRGHGSVFQQEMLRLAKLGAFRNLW
jgi:SprT-like family